MFSRMKDFLYRHRRKFLVTGVLIGGSVLASRYAQRKFLEWQEKEAKAFFDKAKKEHNFRSVEKTCNQTIISLSDVLKEAVLHYFNVEEILEKIRKGEGDKVKLWDELKIFVFAQITSIVYAGLMLVLLLRIQMNIMGGYMFKEKSETLKSDACLPSEAQENYLNLCQHFLNHGVKELCSVVEKQARILLEDVSLKSKLALCDLEVQFWGITAALSEDPSGPLNNLSKYLLPSVDSLETTSGECSAVIKKVVGETLELLDSDEIKAVAESSVKRGFSNLTDEIAEYYTLNDEVTVKLPSTTNGGRKGDDIVGGSQSTNNNKSFAITSVKIPLAKLIPIVHGVSKGAPRKTQVPLIHQYLFVDSINTLGANLYEAFSFSPSTLSGS